MDNKVNPGIAPTVLNLSVEVTDLSSESLKKALEALQDEVSDELIQRGILSDRKSLVKCAALLAGNQSFITLALEFPNFQLQVQVSTPPAAFCPLDKDGNLEKYVEYLTGRVLPKRYKVSTEVDSEYADAIRKEPDTVKADEGSKVHVSFESTEPEIKISAIRKNGDEIWTGSDSAWSDDIVITEDTEVVCKAIKPE